MLFHFINFDLIKCALLWNIVPGQIVIVIAFTRPFTSFLNEELLDLYSNFTLARQ